MRIKSFQMISNKPRIAIITNVLPSYREGFYNIICNSQLYNITVYCQSSIPFANLELIHDKYSKNVRLIKYRFIFNNKILIQRIPLLELITDYEIIVTDGNLRHVNQALYATLLRLLGKKIIIWSVAHSRNNNRISSMIRLFWWKMFRYFFTYTEEDVLILKRLGFKNKVMISSNNGLDQDKIELQTIIWTEEKKQNWKNANKLQNRKIILTVGRINNPYFEKVLEIINELIDYDNKLLWVLIGDGIYKEKLKNKVEKLNISNNVLLLGAIYNEEDLAPWFITARFLLHPHSIGLSLLHAFGYGLPVITHDNKKIQGPEYYLFKNGVTGLSYNYNNFRSLKITICKLLSDECNREQMSTQIKNIAQRKHNTNIMAQNFYKLINIIITSN